MKTKLLTFSLSRWLPGTLLMLCTVALTSCSKDDDPIAEEPEETFDINNPEGYFLYYKGGSFLNGIYEFLPGKKVKTHTAGNSSTLPYTVEDNNIDIEEGIGTIRFVIEDDSVWSPDAYYTEVTLIKASQNNQPAGKTFAGTYYNTDMSVLHQNFFYSFAASGNTVDAGFNMGTAVRTENYTSIGNFAARTELDNGDTEFMVLVNGKLEVNYRVAGGGATIQYGTFAQQ